MIRSDGGLDQEALEEMGVSGQGGLSENKNPGAEKEQTDHRHRNKT